MKRFERGTHREIDMFLMNGGEFNKETSKVVELIQGGLFIVNPEYSLTKRLKEEPILASWYFNPKFSIF